MDGLVGQVQLKIYMGKLKCNTGLIEVAPMQPYDKRHKYHKELLRGSIPRPLGRSPWGSS